MEAGGGLVGDLGDEGGVEADDGGAGHEDGGGDDVAVDEFALVDVGDVEGGGHGEDVGPPLGGDVGEVAEPEPELGGDEGVGGGAAKEGDADAVAVVSVGVLGAGGDVLEVEEGGVVAEEELEGGDGRGRGDEFDAFGLDGGAARLEDGLGGAVLADVCAEEHAVDLGGVSGTKCEQRKYMYVKV